MGHLFMRMAFMFLNVPMKLSFSFIVPVYNRPREVQELFESMKALDTEIPFEVVLVEDGSSENASQVVKAFENELNITYLPKENTGPGPSRNYGMQRANGNYFVILDSDCILPPEYLTVVATSLEEEYVDCYGGPDRAHPGFSPVQRAIDFAMTSLLTTGGIRGGHSRSGSFEPRSFNMGISRKAFEGSGGFGNIHPGEDPDLSIRLKKLGFKVKLIPQAFVYHKRRISFASFYRQVRKFGRVRPILSHWHAGTGRFTYWLPSLFVFGFPLGLLLWLALGSFIGLAILAVYGIYLGALFIGALAKTSSFKTAILAVYATILQFTGYGLGFLESTILVTFSKRKPRELFPDLFY